MSLLYLLLDERQHRSRFIFAEGLGPSPASVHVFPNLLYRAIRYCACKTVVIHLAAIIGRQPAHSPESIDGNTCTNRECEQEQEADEAQRVT